MAIITTMSGVQFDILDPKVEDIRVEDIAHALSNLCRFGGHVREFYSVAQHSVHVSEIVDTEFKLVALMHDATEAYVQDLVAPLKTVLPEYQRIENKIWTCIAKRFELEERVSNFVHAADRIQCRVEMEYLFSHEESKLEFKPWNPRTSFRNFMRTYYTLKGNPLCHAKKA